MKLDLRIAAHADIELARVADQPAQDLHPGDHPLFRQFLEPADDQVPMHLNQKIVALQYFCDEPGPARAADEIRNAPEKPEINIVIVEHISNVGVQDVEVVAEPEMQIHVFLRYNGQIAAYLLGGGQR